MALQEFYATSSDSITASEFSIPANAVGTSSITTDGIITVWFDGITNMVNVDHFLLRVKEKCLSGSTQRDVFAIRPHGLQSQAIITPPLMVMHGWDVTLVREGLSNRTLSASIRGDQSTITQYASLSAVSIGASEISIVSGTTTLATETNGGIYQLWVDPVAASMSKGDEFAVRIYETVGDSGFKRKVFESTLHDAQDQLFVTPMLHLMSGWDMTLQKVSGTDRSFDASIRKVG